MIPYENEMNLSRTLIFFKSIDTKNYLRFKWSWIPLLCSVVTVSKEIIKALY